jgi:uncharacterized FlaG/YvyC family protein
VELQRLSLATLNLNKPLSRAKPIRKPSQLASSSAKKLWSSASDDSGEASSVAEDAQASQKDVLISVSNTVADSNGIDLSSRHLSFAVDGETVINIVDNKTGEVFKQIPSNDILKLKKKMVEIQGLLLDRVV